MIELKTPEDLGAMRAAGKIVATALAAVQEHAGVGVSLTELDAVAARVLEESGAGSSFLNYLPAFAPTPYPAVICASVNDAIVHGIPTDYRLRDGDLVSIDFGAHLDGWHGDAAVSFVVGTPREEDLRLIETTRGALDAAIEVCRPGATLGDIGNAIGPVARSAGYGILAEHGGHGVGRRMHEQPHVPNEGSAGKGMRLHPGLVIAIEPMFTAGGRDEYRTDRDGWTLRTADGSRATHVEHTIAITEDGPLVLTAL
ncbi:type I methionyl aminopeptidase [Kutzneria albida]|nr:type I methionyl aminopeptidase [Kutzneria albida]